MSSNLRLISARRHAENRAIKIDVLSPGELAVKSRSDLQQARDPTANFDATSGRLGDATQNFEKRALASAVAPNDANNFTSGDFKAHILQRPEFFSFGDACGPRPDRRNGAVNARVSASRKLSVLLRSPPMTYCFERCSTLIATDSLACMIDREVRRIEIDFK